MKLFYHILLLSLFCATASAQSVVLSDPNQTYYPFHQSSFLVTRIGQLTIDSLLQHPDRYRFQPLRGSSTKVNDHPFNSDGKTEYWFRIPINSSLRSPLYLHFDLPFLVLTPAYEVADQRVLQQIDLDKQSVNRGWPLLIQPGQTHTLYLRVQATLIPQYMTVLAHDPLYTLLHRGDFLLGLYYGFALLIALYSLMLFSRIREWDILVYAGWIIIVNFFNFSFRDGTFHDWLPTAYPFASRFVTAFSTAAGGLQLLFGMLFLQLRQYAPRFWRVGQVLVWLLVLVVFAHTIDIALGLNWTGRINFYFISLFYAVYGIIISIVAIWHRSKPGWYYLIGTLLIYVSSGVGVFIMTHGLPVTFWTIRSGNICMMLEMLIFLLGLTYKINLLKKHQDEAIQEQLRLTKENQQLVETQNRVLEEKVEQRTAELKASQAQLIQKEKLASLGELTAGIAHEIQNPLNFVNNFSEVSTELVSELKDELDRGDTDEAKAIADDLTQNLQKITHHGHRASSIVKGMLEHSRTSTGEKQPTDLNALADEYLRLAYQGLRAKDKTFNAALITNFAADLGKVDVVPQEIGRVLLNLYNNAFYAVHEKQKTAPVDYQPTVTVSTRQVDNTVEIRVSDNGTGMPESVKAKIFQPFFTTKPTGEGTGLGLSLSYDIVTKGHSGTISVTSVEGEGTELVINLLA